MAIVQYKNFAYLKGPKGDKGDRGPQGDRGPKGDKGDKGDRGLQGNMPPAAALRGVISGSNPIVFDTTTGVISFNSEGFATENYVDSAIANLVAGAPDLLDTLNEIAEALGNNADFVNTVVLKTGGTMTGPLTLSGSPVNNLDAATKEYVDNSISSVPSILTSDDVAEGLTNLYFTEGRARASINVSGDLTYDPATGIIGFEAPALAWDGATFDGGSFDGAEIMPSELTIDGGFLESYYNPAVATDWNETAPTTVQEALDRLAAVVKALNGSVGA